MALLEAPLPHGSLNAAAFSPDGRTIATCGNDDTVRLWNVARQQEIAVLRGHTDFVRSAAFSSDGRWLASGSRDGTVQLWEAQPLEQTDVVMNETAVAQLLVRSDPFGNAFDEGNQGNEEFRPAPRLNSMNSVNNSRIAARETALYTGSIP
jgi:WD40 repeat protein